MNYQAIIDETTAAMVHGPPEGAVADYIPELARVAPDRFGIALCRLDGSVHHAGDHAERFSTQSIAKVFALALAMSHVGEGVWQRVGVEPSGNPFNSLVQLEYEHGVPRNPLINAGAIVVIDLLMNELADPKADLLAFVRRVSGSPTVDYDLAVARSEAACGYRNQALASFMKAFGNLHHDVEAVLDLYYHVCSIAMNCDELARAFLLLANGGVVDGERVLSVLEARRINAIMLTCGFYDQSGEFAFRVGLPGKSGIGGGIVAVQPQQYSVAVWSPRLNAKGNSAAGMKALRLLAERAGSTIF